MATMRAQVLERPYHYELKEVPIPEINDDEVLVKVKYCGICGSDWGSYTGKYKRVRSLGSWQYCSRQTSRPCACGR